MSVIVFPRTTTAPGQKTVRCPSTVITVASRISVCMLKSSSVGEAKRLRASPSRAASIDHDEVARAEVGEHLAAALCDQHRLAHRGRGALADPHRLRQVEHHALLRHRLVTGAQVEEHPLAPAGREVEPDRIAGPLVCTPTSAPPRRAAAMGAVLTSWDVRPGRRVSTSAWSMLLATLESARRCSPCVPT